MLMIETTEKYRCDTEGEAKERMEEFRKTASEKGYLIKKMGYEYKEKKSKGEIIDEGYLLSITKVFGTFWDF